MISNYILAFATIILFVFGPNLQYSWAIGILIVIAALYNLHKFHRLPRVKNESKPQK